MDGIFEQISPVYSTQDGPAWHNKGKPLATDGKWLGEQIREAIQDISPGLASAYYKAPLKAHLPTGEVVDHPLACAIVRAYDKAVLPGTPGESSFGLPQPVEQLREMVRALVRAVGRENLGDARLSFVGLLDAGRKFVASINLGDVEINGERHMRYATLVLGLDGSASREIYYTMVRAVCMNTVASSRHDAQAFADGTDSRAYSKIRNTKNADARSKVAMLDLANMHGEFAGFRERLESYAATKVSEADVATMFESLCKRMGYKDGAKRTENKIRDWTRLYLASGWAGTVNGLHQTFTDRDWLEGQLRPGDRDAAENALSQSFSVSGSTAKFRAQAQAVIDEFMDSVEAEPAAAGVALEDAGIELADW